MTRSIAKSLLRLFGVEIRRLSGSGNLTPSTMNGGLARARERKHRPATVIDVGAAEGKWSLQAMEFWPEAEYLLVEPLEERRKQLERLAGTHRNVHIVNAAAGAEAGEVDFFVTDDLDGSGIADNGTGAVAHKVAVVSVDEVIRHLQLKPPYLLKLDTHGYEAPILRGAADTLRHSELLIIECYGFHVAPGCLLFWELCQRLDTAGFRVIDIVDVIRRRGDLGFWQCDAFFIPRGHECFSRNTFGNVLERQS